MRIISSFFIIRFLSRTASHLISKARIKFQKKLCDEKFSDYIAIAIPIEKKTDTACWNCTTSVCSLRMKRLQFRKFPSVYKQSRVHSVQWEHIRAKL